MPRVNWWRVFAGVLGLALLAALAAIALWALPHCVGSGEVSP